MVKIETASITFAPLSGVGPRTAKVDIAFPASVRDAVAVLTGFSPAFSLNIDHNIGLMHIQVQVLSVKGTGVTVEVVFALRDSSMNWFHHYDGTVSFAVIAEEVDRRPVHRTSIEHRS